MHHVIPRLRTAITLGGHLVRHELESFTHADARVNAIAAQLGRDKLDQRTQEELADWIDCQMLQAVIGPASPDLITPERLAEITGEPRDAAPADWGEQLELDLRLFTPSDAQEAPE